MSEQTNYETPYYAHFEHDDGSWYLLWITHSQPKTERGHPWHVHASFDKHGGLQPVPGGEGWNMGPYGMHNWDFDGEDQALKEFGERLRARLDRGYRIVRAQLPEKDIGS
ncbi:MAG TPA: hypothetical protein VFO07_11580 [Roseiflexaceae bacterium]|nr:hypothetical protein [Roseiflexaceae bacterium]